MINSIIKHQNKYSGIPSKKIGMEASISVLVWYKSVVYAVFID